MGWFNHQLEKKSGKPEAAVISLFCCFFQLQPGPGIEEVFSIFLHHKKNVFKKDDFDHRNLRYPPQNYPPKNKV